MICLKIFLTRSKSKWNFGEVSLLVNDFDSITTELIILIAKNIKRLNIITNHIQKCKKIEEYLYDEFGIMLNISNNKKVSLSKAEIIINIDFPGEIVNKYRIYDKAIILNILEKISIKSKRFNGINASYYKISMPEEYKQERFEDEIIYESLIYKYKHIDVILERATKDKIQIEGLIGNNGIIKEKELNLLTKI